LHGIHACLLLLSLHMKARKLARGEVNSVFQLFILRHT
jgi:hypothetical protein